MTERPRLTIDLNALAQNFATLKAAASGAETAPVVKADGYGLGADAVALRLAQEGARSFYVARTHEGEALRRTLGPGPAIRVLEGATADTARRLTAANLDPVLNHVDQVAVWRATQPNTSLIVHVDTGMNRLGLTPDEASRLGGDVSLVLSHLACAAEPNHPLNTAQLKRFLALAPAFPKARFSFASSAGVFLGRDYHFDEVRPGISLYGGGPNEIPDPLISPVAKLEAPILQLRDVSAGDSIGYGAEFTAQAPLRAAILGVGYADGLLRALSPNGYGVLAGKLCRVMGRLSMDLMVIDVTHEPTARVGAWVELIGPHAPLDTVATIAETTAYELLTRLSPRLQRRYIGEAK